MVADKQHKKNKKEEAAKEEQNRRELQSGEMKRWTSCWLRIVACYCSKLVDFEIPFPFPWEEYTALKLNFWFWEWIARSIDRILLVLLPHIRTWLRFNIFRPLSTHLFKRPFLSFSLNDSRKYTTFFSWNNNDENAAKSPLFNEIMKN